MRTNLAACQGPSKLFRRISGFGNGGGEWKLITAMCGHHQLQIWSARSRPMAAYDALRVKADWRGDGSRTSIRGSRPLGLVLNEDESRPRHEELNRRSFTCAECGHVEGRDRKAARNVYWHGEERRNHVCEDRGGRRRAGHAFGFVPVPIVEPRIETHGGYMKANNSEHMSLANARKPSGPICGVWVKKPSAGQRPIFTQAEIRVRSP
jgi:hypothetical protein